MAYYNDQAWATPSNSGVAFGTHALGNGWNQANPLFGGGSAYYDTAQNGQAGYEQYVQGLTGGNPTGRFGQWLRSNFYNNNNAYGAAQGKDPSLSFTQYLQNQTPDLTRQYGEQSQQSRGNQGQRALKWL